MAETIALAEAISLGDDVCARERIQLPGSIQPHGLLVGLVPATLALVTKSANVDDLFPGTEVGAPPAWLPQEIADACRGLDAANRPECVVAADIVGIGCVEVHCFIAHDVAFCEFEPAGRIASAAEMDALSLATEAATAAMKAADAIPRLAAVAAEAIRAASGFERVLVYRFDKGGDGDVIGESLAEDWQQSFLGLRFPATDIPAQARELYRVTEQRWLPHRDYQPVPLTPDVDAAGLPFELGRSRYRSVSPIHRIYQKNIGVDGAMSVSIIRDEVLWGLVIGHHRHAHRVPLFRQRQVVALVRAFTMRMDALSNHESKLELERDTQAYSAMLRKLAAAEDFLAALTEGSPSVKELLPDCVGAAVIWTDDGRPQVRSLGQVPPHDALVTLTDWLRLVAEGPVVASECLSDRFPAFLAHRETASGVLACFFEDDRHPTLLLFRPEIVQSVSWAGKPEKMVGPEGLPNLPRRSFDRWTEIRRGQSRPWQPWELDIATTICSTVNDVIVRQARRVRDLDIEVARFDQALTLSGTTLYHQDRDLRYLWLHNPYIGFAPKTPGMTDWDVLDPELAERIVAVKQRVLASGVGERLAIPSRRDDPEAEWYDLSVEPLRGDDGAVTGLSCAAVRITDRVLASRRLQEAHDHLERQAKELARSNSDLAEFAAVVSHDLRQPLRMVGSYLGLIERRMRGRLGADETEFLDFAISGAKRMDLMILDLLEYSRIGRDAAPMNAVSLAEVVADALQNLQVAIEDAAAVIVVASELPAVIGNPIELTRLFQNLIGNAVKYRKPDSIPNVEIDCRRSGRDWLISVKDNGIGIAPESQERVFAIFQRLVSRDAYDGTGIGLAVCKKIVERHGGRIWIDSVAGEGSTFLFTLQDGFSPAHLG